MEAVFTSGGEPNLPQFIGEDDGPDQVSAPIVSLKDRRKAIVDDLFIDVQVPRWDEPEIFVRFKPISSSKLDAAVEKRRASKADNWATMANADALVQACIGIYGVFPNDPDKKVSLRPGDPDGEWTKFDPDLAEALGVPAPTAADTVLALYLTEGDLVMTASKVFRWSGIASEEADSAF